MTLTRIVLMKYGMWGLGKTVLEMGSRKKGTKCLLKDEWINKMQYIHTMGHYSAMKRIEYRNML